MKQRELVNRLRTFCLTIATHIGRGGMEAGCGKRLNLMPPRVPGFRKTVTQNHQGARSLFGHVHADAVRFDRPMADFVHNFTFDQFGSG
jgi:hypothetical protein